MARTKQAARRATPSRPQQGPGGDPGRRVLLIAAVVVVLVVLVYVGWSVANDPSREIEARTAELVEQEEARDRQQIGELTEQARAMAGDFGPMLEAMDQAMPTGAEPGPLVDADTVAGWRDTAAAAATAFEDPPSGTTGTNVARNSFAVAVDSFEVAIDTYALALEAGGEQQTALIEQAGAQRDLAVQSWAIGATQLDQINVDAGFGHQHVYLETEAGGALTPDGAEEGSDAAPQD